jgi:hypothetical protein
VLDDRDRRGGVVARHPVGRVEVEQVVEGGSAALDLGRVGERAGSVRRLAVERGRLVRVLAVAQVVDLLQDERQALRKDVAGDLVEVGGDLRVVGRDRTERLRGQLRAKLRRDLAALLQLGDDAVVMLRAGDRRHSGRVPGGGAEERSAADVDHLDCLVEAHQVAPDLRRERLDVDDDEVDQPDALLDELVELLRDVAAGQDPGINRRMECLDLAADEGGDLGQLRDRGDLDAVRREVLAGSVGREQLHAEGLELAGQRGHAVAVGD